MSIYFNPNAQAVYSVWLKNKNGQYLAIFDNFSFLSYGRIENEIGTMKLIIPVDDRASFIQEDFVFEIWRKLPGRKTYLDGETEWRIKEIKQIESAFGNEFQIKAMDTIELLNRPVVAYHSGTSYTDKSGAAGSVIREFVNENCGPGVSSSDRWIDRQFDSGFFSIETNKSLGQTVTVNNAIGKKLINVLQDAANQSDKAGTPIFFDIVRRGNNDLEFQTFAEQRGTDLRGKVTLDARFGTLEEASITQDFTRAFNIVHIGGAGQSEDRLIGTSSNTATSPFDMIEKFINASRLTTQAGVDDVADQELAGGGRRLLLDAKIIDTVGLQYGVHYKFGSRVSCGIGGNAYTARFSAVQITIQNGQEDVRVGLTIDE